MGSAASTHASASEKSSGTSHRGGRKKRRGSETHIPFDPRKSLTGQTGDINADYTIAEELGHGHYGVVRLGTNRVTGQQVAIKTVRKARLEDPEQMKAEIEILQALDHPNIIKLYKVYEDTTNIHLVQELCTGGELFDRIIKKQHFTEHEARGVVKIFLDAIDYCHEHNIVHRDLKPENFIYQTDADDADIKVIDFGLGKHSDHRGDHMKARVGTPYYIAPEVLNRDYTEKCDIWSIGVITYILLCGYPPFWGDNDQEIFGRVQKGEVDFDAEEWEPVSPEGKGFIRMLLTMDQNNRPSAKEALKHTWFDEHDNEDHASRKAVLSGNMLGQLKHFTHHNRLKKMALHVIAEQLTSKEIANLKEVFNNIDEDKTGNISIANLSHAIIEAGFHATEAEVRELLEGMDINHDHQINYEEFVAATLQRNEFMKQDRLLAAYRHFDTDGSGQISIANLVEVMGSEEHAREVMGSADLNHDGVISYEEFKSLMADGNSLVADAISGEIAAAETAPAEAAPAETAAIPAETGAAETAPAE